MTDEATTTTPDAAATTATPKKTARSKRPAPFRIYDVTTFKLPTGRDDDKMIEIKALVPLKHPDVADSQGAMKWIKSNAKLLEGKRLEIHQVRDSFTLQTEVRILVKR